MPKYAKSSVYRVEQENSKVIFEMNLKDMLALDKELDTFKPDLHVKLVAENMKRPFCLYDWKYQYLFNQYYVRTTDNDVCLLHYIDKDTLKDMGQRNANNGYLYHSYPGNGFYPIDYSYLFLENNSCAYVEVEVRFELSITISESMSVISDKRTVHSHPTVRISTSN
uniref:Uncharacterized protein n=1 Tax=Setaria digitata TaxID=48799 RepID=A0A915PD59_9BILA